MLDPGRVVGFDWDAGNTAKSAAKHGVSTAEAEQVFSSYPLLITPDEAHSRSERRFRALGQTISGRVLTIIFTLRDHDTKIRVISARDMNRKERGLYEGKAQTHTPL